MERANKNIDELLETLHGTLHRLRQSGIDEELFDVISGFEALTARKSVRLLVANTKQRDRGRSAP
jgi:F-type H+-transporting ATPase subunit gamma